MSADFKWDAGPQNAKTFHQMGRTEQLTKQGIRKGWFEIGDSILREVNRATLVKPRLGRVYIVRGPSGRKRRHVASRPGESHANLSGKLRRSRSYRVGGYTSIEIGYGVSSTAKNAAPAYAGFVDKGTRRMKPRPTITNAINSEQRNIERYFGQYIVREFKGAR